MGETFVRWVIGVMAFIGWWALFEMVTTWATLLIIVLSVALAIVVSVLDLIIVAAAEALSAVFGGW